MLKSKTHRLANGLTIVGEENEQASSVAVSLLIPTGAAYEAEGKEGTGALLFELLQKGAGGYSSRELSEEFDKIGVQRSSSGGVETSSFWFASLPDQLPRALELTAFQVREPLLPESELENVRQLALQDLISLEDEPSSKVMVELSREYYPAPFGRSQMGTVEGVKSASIADVRALHQTGFKPGRSILAVAGKFNWDGFIALADKCFGSWDGESPLREASDFKPVGKYQHIHQETSQLQIALAYPSVSSVSPEFYTARVAVGLLSGGMAGRLFIEVREKRGLVYSVHASHSAQKGRAAIFSYAGTTPQRGQETLDVMLTELRNVGKNISDDELIRSKSDIKSRVVMANEVSSSRVSALAADYWNLGRVRTVEEVKAAIDAVTAEDIAKYSESHPVDPITLVTLGSQRLEIK